MNEAEAINKIIHTGADSFMANAEEVFTFQYHNNPLYRRFADLTGGRSGGSWPFLPISFFKTHRVHSSTFVPEQVFESSGTTGSVPSRHEVRSLATYEAVSLAGFERSYGSLHGWCVLALLPSYLERGQSSLVYMVQHFMNQSGHPDNGFFLHNHADLAARLKRLEASGQKTLLIGVTYALLDFAAAFPLRLRHTIVMETGGMKGRRRELVRDEVHALLRQAFHVPAIHSEYGMTELLSQAYACSDGLFCSPPWMQVWVAAEDDPADCTQTPGKSGRLCIADLANRWSCSFIATEDVARLHDGGRFEVLGRLDHSDIRGCSLLTVSNEG